MKRLCVAFSIVALLLLLMGVASAEIIASGNCGAYDDNAQWTLTDDGTLTITGTGLINNYETANRRPWNSHASEIQSVRIGAGITNVGNLCFYNCTNLTQVDIPDGVTSLMHSCFMNCRNLETITIPDSVYYIDYYTFTGCTSLREIVFPRRMSYIYDFAFEGCTALEYVTLPAALTYIPQGVFKDCTSLSDVTYTDSALQAAQIDIKGSNQKLQNAAWHCTDGDFSEIPKKLGASIAGAIDNQGNLRIMGEGKMSLDIYPYTVYGARIRTATVDPGITSLSIITFYNCTNLTRVTLPDSIISIDKSCFSGCTALTDVYYGGSPVQAAEIAIAEGNESLAAVNWHYALIGGDCGTDGDHLTWALSEEGMLAISGTGTMMNYTTAADVPWYAYRTDIITAVIEPGTASLGSHCFEDCSNLASIAIPDSVTTVGANCFSNCAALTDVDYSGTEMQRSLIAFATNEDALQAKSWQCILLDTAVLPAALDTIDAEALAGIGAERIDIPATVQAIASGAFSDCINLRELVFEGDPITIAQDALSGCRDVVIYVPAGSTAEEWANATGFTVYIR